MKIDCSAISNVGDFASLLVVLAALLIIVATVFLYCVGLPFAAGVFIGSSICLFKRLVLTPLEKLVLKSLK